MDKSKQNCELVELVLMHNTSIRLRNCMLSAQKSGQLPFTTLDEYISAGNEALRMLLKIPNLGKNTALEFDSLVKNADLKKMYRMESTIKQEPVKEDLSSPLHKLVLADVASYLIGHIDDHIANRIINVLEDIQTSEKLRLCPLSIYLTETNPIRFLMKQANIGNSSAVKFNEFINKLVNNTIDHISIQEIYDDKYAVEKGEAATLTSDKNSIVDIQDIFKQILSAQQYKILISRSVKSLTLESLGEHYDLTRERIRQIESTSIKKIVDRFKKPITEFVKKVDEILDDSYGQILLKDCCEVIDANESTIRLLIYISKNIFKRAVKIKDGVISRCSSEENYTEWNSQIDNILFSMRWPIDYKELEDKLTGIPGSYVGHYLHAKRGVIIDDNVIISIKKIPKTVLMTFVLRDEDKAMTPDEVVKKMRNMFGVEMTAHSAGAVLSRMDNALIVARGVYALYESLPISEYILEEIRNDSYKYIIEKQNFISSKVLYQDVFSKKYSKIDILNEYVILGILQDDIRFITKRGLMVGLKDFVHSVEIKPLKEEILELVQQEGPISVTDIQKRLAESRRILFVTINIFLEADERVIRVSPGTYDAVEKVFECKEDYYDLKSAVQIVIVDMPSSLFSIQTKIKTIPSLKKNNINQSIIQSVLRRIDGVKKINGIYSIENINDDIFSYDELIKHAIINNYEIDQINEQAVDIFGEKIAENLMGLDYRLYVASLIQMENSEISNEKDELHSIFEAFGL